MEEMRVSLTNQLENTKLNKYSRAAFGGVEILIEGDSLSAAICQLKHLEEQYTDYNTWLELEIRDPTYKCNCCPGPTTSKLLLSGSETNDSILNRLQTSLIDSEQIDYQEIMEMRCLEEENPK